MTAKEWIEHTYTVVDHDLMGQVIVWENKIGFYGIYTPVDKFLELFGTVIQSAIDSEKDIRQAIRHCDPDNVKGFYEFI